LAVGIFSLEERLRES